MKRALLCLVVLSACVENKKQEPAPAPRETASAQPDWVPALASAVASAEAREATPAKPVERAELQACADELPKKVQRIDQTNDASPATAAGALSLAKQIRRAVDTGKVAPIDQQLICELSKAPDTPTTATKISELARRLEGKLY